MIIEFDETAHVYTVDGKKVPSVTQIVAPLGQDYDEPDDMTETVVDAAAERGTVMHAYIAWRLDGGAPEAFEMPDMYVPYADAVDLFLAEHSVVPVAVEEPLGCDSFAGTPDLICEFDGQLAVLDWKFVSQVAKSKVGAQLAGYDELCRINGLFVDRLFAVQFTKDGSYRLYPVGWDAARAAFFEALGIYRIKTAKHPRGRIFEEDKQ